MLCFCTACRIIFPICRNNRGVRIYLTSFVHREKLFNIAERWFCGRTEPEDVRALTKILICDVFIVKETLEVFEQAASDNDF